MPTNIALDALRTRRGLKWGAPAALIALPYLFIASFTTTLIDQGASKWLYLIALVCIWNALKFIANGVISLPILIKVRYKEHRYRKEIQQLENQQLVNV